MISPEDVEQSLQNAIGRFEYSIDGGGLITRAYKYVYFEPSAGTPLIFKGRDTSNSIRESGITFTFSQPSFWGDKVVLGDEVSVMYFELGTRYDVLSGSITGVAEGLQKTGFVEFDLTVDHRGVHRRVKGLFLLKTGSDAS